MRCANRRLMMNSRRTPAATKMVAAIARPRLSRLYIHPSRRDMVTTLAMQKPMHSAFEINLWPRLLFLRKMNIFTNAPMKNNARKTAVGAASVLGFGKP